ncbi:MAG: GtrA family protein [Propionibacteriaceae bacterium]|nr:GtrA family protein [Propionibacteriaceae bacterium]
MNPEIELPDTPEQPSGWLAKLPLWLVQFVKFGLVGASGIVVNMLVAFIMNKLNGGAVNARMPVWSLPGGEMAIRYSYIVYAAAFVVANTTNYQLNRWWTFKGTQRKWWRGYVMFFAAGILGAVVGFVVKVILTHPGSPLYLPSWFTDSGWRAREYWGQLAGVLVGTPVNFIVNRLSTFRHHATKSTPNGGDA